MADSLYSTYLLKRSRAEATRYLEQISARTSTWNNTNSHDSRLGSQHMLWKLHMNHVIHPDIPIKDGMAIADIGAGTGYVSHLVGSSGPHNNI